MFKKKKKAVKKVYKPNTLSKVLNVLPYIPVGILIIYIIAAQ